MLLAAALGGVGCGLLSDPVVCTTDIRPAITVDVRDSVTDTFAGAGARVIATDGAFADTADASAGFPHQLAFERPDGADLPEGENWKSSQSRKSMGNGDCFRMTMGFGVSRL